jgi:hypothetical protein
MRESAAGEADVTAPKPSDNIVIQLPSDAQKTPKGKAARRQRWKARRKNKLEDLKFTDDPPYQRQQHQLFTGESGAARGSPKPWDKKNIASWPRKGKKRAKGKSEGKGKQKAKRK